MSEAYILLVLFSQILWTSVGQCSISRPNGGDMYLEQPKQSGCGPTIVGEGGLVVGRWVALVVDGGELVACGGLVVVGKVIPRSKALTNNRAFSFIVGWPEKILNRIQVHLAICYENSCTVCMQLLVFSNTL